MLNVHLGWDSREVEAFNVAKRSCEANSSRPVHVHALAAQELYRRRLLWRPVETGGGDVMVDHLSGSRQSTEFAVSRFLVPFIQRTGWALFTDCDVLFLGDVAELFALADPGYAVMCVKHRYIPAEQSKMDGQAQLAYGRKNWSSVVLWNCDHPANLRLNPGIVNWWPRQLLHQFCWLTEDEIGALPAEWNWLVNVEPRPDNPKIAHYTLGGPWLPGWKGAEHDEIWTEHYHRYRPDRRAAGAG